MDKKICLKDADDEIIIGRRNGWLVISVGGREYRTHEQALVIDAINDVMSLLPSELPLEPDAEEHRSA